MFQQSDSIPIHYCSVSLLLFAIFAQVYRVMEWLFNTGGGSGQEKWGWEAVGFFGGPKDEEVGVNLCQTTCFYCCKINVIRSG